MNKREIPISLTKYEAIVLFEFLARFTDNDKLSVEDPAEEQVLWNVHGLLEKVLSEPFSTSWGEILDHARKCIQNGEN